MKTNITIKYDPKTAPKTGDWKYMKPEVDAKKCIGCGTCVKFCPEAAIVVERESHIANRNSNSGSTIHDPRYANIDYEWCKGCGVCAEVCPVKAILMKKN